MTDENEFLTQNEIDDILARGGHSPKPEADRPKQVQAVVGTLSSTTELSHCPFCGSDSHVYFLLGWTVLCNNDNCGCNMGKYNSRESAIKTWNKRA